MKRRRRPRLPTSVKSLPCVLLAVDPAKRSGWAIYLDGELVDYGTARADRLEDVSEVVTRALELGEEHGRQVVLLGEEWGRGGKMDSVRTSAGLGAAWGTWKLVARATCVGKSKIALKRILRVPTATWRARFGMNSRMGTEALKRHAVRIANLRHRLDLELAEHDVAEAVLLGEWGRCSGEVGSVLTTIRAAVAKLRESVHG